MTKPGGSFCFGDQMKDNYSYSINKMGKKFYAVVPFINLKGETPGTYL